MKTLDITLKNLTQLDEPISVAALYALSGLEKAKSNKSHPAGTRCPPIGARRLCSIWWISATIILKWTSM